MDSSTFKLLLEAQERAYKSALDVVVRQLNDQVTKLDKKVAELTTSLEFTQREVDDLKSNAKEHEKEKKEDRSTIDTLNQRLQSSHLKIKELEEKVTYQEDYSRRKNLRISGLEERGDETWEQTAAAVTSLLESKLQIPGIILERAHRVGQRRDARPRPVVARFARYGDRDAAIRRGRHLKGTNIYLNEDLSAASLAIKNAQMPLLKQARAEGKVAFFRHTKLIIRDKTFGSATGLDVRAGRAAEAGGWGLRGGRVPVTAVAGAGDAADGADAAAGAVGAAGAPDGAGDADGDGGVVRVEAAGAWGGVDNTRSPLPAHRPGDSRLSSAPPAASSPQRKEIKKILHTKEYTNVYCSSRRTSHTLARRYI